MIGQFIKNIDTHEMGGNVTVDLVHLPDGRVLGVNDECVVLYSSLDDFLFGGTSDAPTIDLLED
jgi:hypothetical protein